MVSCLDAVGAGDLAEQCLVDAFARRGVVRGHRRPGGGAVAVAVRLGRVGGVLVETVEGQAPRRRSPRCPGPGCSPRPACPRGPPRSRRPRQRPDCRRRRNRCRRWPAPAVVPVVAPTIGAVAHVLGRRRGGRGIVRTARRRQDQHRSGRRHQRGGPPGGLHRQLSNIAWLLQRLLCRRTTLGTDVTGRSVQPAREFLSGAGDAPPADPVHPCGPVAPRGGADQTPYGVCPFRANPSALRSTGAFGAS